MRRLFRRGQRPSGNRTGPAGAGDPPASGGAGPGRKRPAVGLAQAASQPVRELSGGMRRRVAIARAVCAGPQLLLLDEAFKGLDDQCRRDTVAYIRRHTPGASLLCVTHDPEEAALLGGRCLDLSTL